MIVLQGGSLLSGLLRVTSGIKALTSGSSKNLLSQRRVCIKAYLSASLRNRTRGHLRGHQILSPAIAGRNAVNPFIIVPGQK